MSMPFSQFFSNLLSVTTDALFPMILIIGVLIMIKATKHDLTQSKAIDNIAKELRKEHSDWSDKKVQNTAADTYWRGRYRTWVCNTIESTVKHTKEESTTTATLVKGIIVDYVGTGEYFGTKSGKWGGYLTNEDLTNILDEFRQTGLKFSAKFYSLTNGFGITHYHADLKISWQ